jgi:hypothetical protein
MTNVSDELRMTDAAIADAERALEEYHGPDKGGDNNLRRLNLSSFVGGRYGSVLVADWKTMRALLVERDQEIVDLRRRLAERQFSGAEREALLAASSALEGFVSLNTGDLESARAKLELLDD